MATVKLSLVKDVWQEIGAFAFEADKGAPCYIELTVADALPVGDVPSHKNNQTVTLHHSAPAAGSWYARVRFTETGTLIVTEVA